MRMKSVKYVAAVEQKVPCRKETKIYKQTEKKLVKAKSSDACFHFFSICCLVYKRDVHYFCICCEKKEKKWQENEEA